MQATNDRIVTAIFVIALLILPLSFFNLWFAFALATSVLLVLGLALGFGSHHRPIRRTLILLSAGYTLLLVAMVWADRAGGSPWLVLGFPAATALLVYGIWPMPLIAGLLYALVFRSSVLPEDKLQKFLAEHSPQSR